MRTFRLDCDEMAELASKVIDYAENPEYRLICDPGNARSFGGKVSQLVIVTIQQKPINQLLLCSPPAPTFHFRFKVDHFSDRISMNWDKVETTVYHLDGKSGMIVGEMNDSLKEFLSSHILLAIQQPKHAPAQRRAVEMSN
jgi:hypothetical protein